jgi:hypothetical protein
MAITFAFLNSFGILPVETMSLKKDLSQFKPIGPRCFIGHDFHIHGADRNYLLLD